MRVSHDKPGAAATACASRDQSLVLWSSASDPDSTIANGVPGAPWLRR